MTHISEKWWDKIKKVGAKGQTNRRIDRQRRADRHRDIKTGRGRLSHLTKHDHS